MAPPPGDLPGNTASGPVQMAQMVSRAAQSEMRIGLNTAAFGNVEVRTVVHANEVGIMIGSEKGDLRALLSNELPGIASALQQQNLRLNPVNFHQQGFAFSHQMSSGGDPQSRSFVRRPSPATSRQETGAGELVQPVDTPGVRPSSGSLSILA
jgi:flagellar hook-length control protein FliK